MGTSQSLTWHEACLKSMRDHHFQLKLNITELSNRAQRLAEDILVLDNQITRAKKEGRINFDADRYNKSRN